MENKNNKLRKTIFRICAAVIAFSGIVILTGVFYPILSYNSTYSKKFELISPIPENSKVDYTKASNWFVGGATSEDFTKQKVDTYSISIPKLRIDKAKVAIGGEDLSKEIIHYPGTALPGKRGNTVLFGHSALPIFYNPKNYLTVFSLLPTLNIGDEISVDYDGISFKYKVETMFEVLPTDIQVLDQDYSDSFLTLVTCVPPGDPRNPKRLIVRARIVPP